MTHTLSLAKYTTAPPPSLPPSHVFRTANATADVPCATQHRKHAADTCTHTVHTTINAYPQRSASGGGVPVDGGDTATCRRRGAGRTGASSGTTPGEPQSVEGPDRYPETGVADEEIAAAGNQQLSQTGAERLGWRPGGTRSSGVQRDAHERSRPAAPGCPHRWRGAAACGGEKALEACSSGTYMRGIPRPTRRISDKSGKLDMLPMRRLDMLASRCTRRRRRFFGPRCRCRTCRPASRTARFHAACLKTTWRSCCTVEWTERCDKVHISLPVFTIPKRDGTSRLLVDGRPFDERSRPLPAPVLPGLADNKVRTYICKQQHTSCGKAFVVEEGGKKPKESVCGKREMDLR